MNMWVGKSLVREVAAFKANPAAVLHSQLQLQEDSIDTDVDKEFQEEDEY